jgi:Trk K+ transport system NAD-binding subunit
VFGVEVIDPLGSLAGEVADAARGPVASALATLKGGGVVLVWTRVRAGMPRRPLRMLGLPAGSRVALVARGARRIVPDAETVLMPGDDVLLVANAAVAPSAQACLGLPRRPSSRVRLTGAAGIRHWFVSALRRENVPVTRAGAAVRARVARGASLERPMDMEVELDGGTEARITAVQAVARRVIRALARSAIVRVGSLLPGRLDVYLVRAGRRGRWLRRPLREVRGLQGWTVLALESGRSVYLPHPDDVIQTGETVVIGGPPGRARVLADGLTGESPIHTDEGRR